jgi:DNA-binding NarL/FixJ family response regulator
LGCEEQVAKPTVFNGRFLFALFHFGHHNFERASNQKIMESKKATIILADNHKIVRQVIKDIIEGMPNFRVIAEADDVSHALQLTQSLNPDVLIFNSGLSAMMDLDIACKSKKISPVTKVIVLLLNDLWVDKKYEVPEFGGNEIDGYVLIESSVEELCNAINTVVSGRSFISSSLR